MPDANKKEENPHFPTMKQAFWVTSRAPAIIEHLLKEEQKSWRHAFHESPLRELKQIRDHLSDIGQSRRAIVTEALNKSNISILADEFFGLTYPVDHPRQRKVSVMEWITDRYLNETHNGEQILAEDLYKIGQDVRYFSRLQSGGHIKDITIEEHATLTDLQETLKPFAAKRAAKKLESLERHMGADAKNEIMAGTTIMHQSDLGKIIMVHTIRASQYWGSNTKWCISGDDTAGWAFPDYYGAGPIIMLLPKGGQKEALVYRKFWVPEDKSFNETSVAHMALIDEMLNANPQWAKKFQDFLPAARKSKVQENGPNIFQKIFESVAGTIQNLGNKEPDPKDSFPSWKKSILKNIKTKGFMYDVRYDDRNRMYLEDALKDKDIALAMVSQHGKNLEYLDISMRQDKDVIRAAANNTSYSLDNAAINIWEDRIFAFELIKENIDVLGRAPFEMIEDRDFMLSAIDVNERAFEYADLTLQKSRSFALDALRRNHEVLEFIDDKFMNNPHFIAKALMINPKIVINIRHYTDIALIDNETIHQAQIHVLGDFLQQGNHDEAQDFLRHIKLLWGQADRILGDPAEQLSHLQSLRHLSVNAAPQAFVA